MTSQQSVSQAARRSALNAQAVLRKQRADRERRLEALAGEALTALSRRTARVNGEILGVYRFSWSVDQVVLRCPGNPVEFRR